MDENSQDSEMRSMAALPDDKEIFSDPNSVSSAAAAWPHRETPGRSSNTTKMPRYTTHIRPNPEVDDNQSFRVDHTKHHG